ncbi:AfsR/SARP family transcriptional regulator [Salininema proteolyticum]|uniref:BTAD domain-containing putative transcriptional regulator n=1 Tax=Salininema proteolyticum TaxID=1607685 RepID=A0ABV8U154_9ACTN
MTPVPEEARGRRLRVDLLGPVRCRVAEEPVDLPGRQLPQLLALLALNADRPVGLSRIAEVVWDGERPERVRRMTVNLVGRLRRALNSEAPDGGAGPFVERTGDSVVLRRTETDLAEFDRESARARTLLADSPARAADLLRGCLDLCRGEPMPGWEGAYFSAEKERLRLKTAETRDTLARALAASGSFEEALDLSRRLLEGDPLNQAAATTAVSALAALGKVPEASGLYHAFRTRLARETGLDPGPALIEAHTRALAGSTLAESGDDVLRDVPRQVPAPPADFAGREKEARLITEAVLSGPSDTVNAVAVNGLGGMGKSALAFRVARQVAEHFPDGQFYADLAGSTQGTAPRDPAAVLDRFLNDLGRSNPGTDPDAAAARFRSATRGKRLLIVLDNARDADQIRPLLPADPGCAVLITARRSLAAIDSTTNLHLRELNEPSSIDLLRTAIRRDRDEADTEALRRIAAACGGMPLALCVAAARLRMEPRTSAKSFARRLESADYRLAELDDGSRAVGTALAASLDNLSGTPDGEAAATLFRLCGLHHGDDWGLEAVAALSGRSRERAGRLAGTLVRARLWEQASADRWRTHDLVRLYARAEAAALDHETRETAGRRLREFYAASAHRALSATYPDLTNRLGLLPDRIVRKALPFSGAAEAFQWANTETDGITALVESSPDGDDGLLAAITAVLAYPVCTRSGVSRSRLLDLATAAVRIVELRPRPWDYYLHMAAGHQLLAFRRFADAEKAFASAVERARAAGRYDLVPKVATYEADAALRAGDHATAEAKALAALRDAEATGNVDAEVWSLIHLARAHVGRGALDVGLSYGERSLGLLDRVLPPTRTSVLLHHGFCLLRAREWEEASDLLRRCCELLVGAGETPSDAHAEALWGLAEAHGALGDGRTAAEFRERSVEMGVRIGGIGTDDTARFLSEGTVERPGFFSVR